MLLESDGGELSDRVWLASLGGVGSYPGVTRLADIAAEAYGGKRVADGIADFISKAVAAAADAGGLLRVVAVAVAIAVAVAVAMVMMAVAVR